MVGAVESLQKMQRALKAVDHLISDGGDHFHDLNIYTKTYSHYFKYACMIILC